jgi:hypothetical protein
MRAVFVLLSILLVAACASGNGSPSKSGTPSSMVARAPTMTDDEAATYIADLATERMEAVCGEGHGITTQLECARDALFRGFDTTGEAKRHCEPDAAFRDIMRCMDTASLDKSVRCMSRTFLNPKFESAIARMGPGEVRA